MKISFCVFCILSASVPDPHVFGPPGSGSGSISQRYGSGSGSFYQQGKIIRKTLIPTALWLLFWLFIFENEVNAPSKSNKQKKVLNKRLVFVGILKVIEENSRIRIHWSEAWIRGSRSGSTPKCHGSATLLSAYSENMRKETKRLRRIRGKYLAVLGEYAESF